MGFPVRRGETRHGFSQRADVLRPGAATAAEQAHALPHPGGGIRRELGG
jgi:hypothetical protein